MWKGEAITERYSMTPPNLCQSPLHLCEILVNIFCDDLLQFKDVLSFERVCKSWRGAVASRLVWRSLLSRLDDEHAPDLLPQVNIDLLTASELKDVVVRAHQKHMRWSSLPGVSPSSSREIVLPAIRDVDGGSYHLLPGGQHLLVLSSVVGDLPLNFTLFHVPTERRVWDYSDRLRGKLLIPVSFTASYSASDTDTIVITAVALMESVDDGNCDTNGSADGSFVLVLRLRLSTGECEVLFRRRIKEPTDIEPLDISRHTGMSQGLLSRGDSIVIHYSREYMLFLDYRILRYRWVKMGPQQIYVQRMFFLDDSLFGVVDAYNEDVGTVETSIVVVHVMDTLLEAPRLDSADPQDQAISFRDVISLRTYPMPDLQLYALLSVRKFKAHWRGESTTYITLLMKPKSPRLYGQEYEPTGGVTVVKYKWEPVSRPISSKGPGLDSDYIQEWTLKFISREEIGGYERQVPPHSFRYFSNISQSGRCIAALSMDKNLYAFTIGALERQALIDPLRSLDLSHKNLQPLRLLALDYYSGAVHVLSPDSRTLLLYYFD